MTQAGMNNDSHPQFPLESGSETKIDPNIISNTQPMAIQILPGFITEVASDPDKIVFISISNTTT